MADSLSFTWCWLLPLKFKHLSSSTAAPQSTESIQNKLSATSWISSSFCSSSFSRDTKWNKPLGYLCAQRQTYHLLKKWTTFESSCYSWVNKKSDFRDELFTCHTNKPSNCYLHKVRPNSERTSRAYINYPKEAFTVEIWTFGTRKSVPILQTCSQQPLHPIDFLSSIWLD